MLRQDKEGGHGRISGGVNGIWRYNPAAENWKLLPVRYEKGAEDTAKKLETGLQPGLFHRDDHG